MFLLFVKNKGIRAIYLCRPSRNGAFDPNLRYKDKERCPDEILSRQTFHRH